MKWRFIGTESPQEIALSYCTVSYDSGDGSSHNYGDIWGGGLGDGLGHCYGDSNGDSWCGSETWLDCYCDFDGDGFGVPSSSDEGDGVSAG